MLAAIALPGAAVLGLCASLLPADEVVLTLGDSYEKVRNRSRAALPPLEKNTNWAGAVSRPARLRFTEPGKSFVTPPAKFLAVTYDARGLVDGVRLSPQLDALPLNETLAIVTDLQDQLRQAWTPFRSKRWQPIQDDVATRNAIRRCDDPTARWNGGSELQLSIDIRCLRTDARPDDERFLITLVLSRPWVDDRE
ncbi:MAG TPA: flagellar biosynthesis sigma factor [Paraburkholderia sp.]|jgi:hypothetical protein|nr:flagellar biosynthesis sigma factor [Paraburkholderia sp.]